MAPKPKKTGRYPGPGYDESGGAGNPVPPKKKASTKYSPAPMSAAAKAKAGARGKATARQYKDLPKKPFANIAEFKAAMKKLEAQMKKGK
jgi:hypothetical protein